MYYIAVPDGVGRINLICDAVDLINQCTVTWNVSVYDLCIAILEQLIKILKVSRDRTKDSGMT